MEALTRLVSESLARHGFDRPLDYRRLQWSRWFRCESHHSLLFVPSKPGVFALAEEMMDLGTHVDKNDHAEHRQPAETATTRVETGTLPVPRTLSEARGGGFAAQTPVEERRLSAASAASNETAALAAAARRLLAVTQFFDADDMAFVLDRMLSRQNPMRARLASGRYFVRFVVIESELQRRSICSALNQWIVNSTEKATGIGPHFASSLELTPQTEYRADEPPTERVARTLMSATAGTTRTPVETNAHVGTLPVPRTLSETKGSGPAITAPTSAPTTPHLSSGAATNIHCPFPSGF